ncbi:acyl carrier protein [Anabaena cylindrica FACHB-243]|uniref:Acyl carrier protein n=1 Tax=Anabaena cylindrica (strain ATCC 27899 / PCC 7122) TaxID=272123 RepID=K9ZCD4_ANACC|nr:MULTISPECIES: acyl carrier protein [Anabaena]AFZ56831.1 Acyl carrier protein [Anabaena cylindrica PCC 7122]MBD2418958.1 acyl carrier protein [Anabaena cylindrica FACHB-243]MBY5285100.1 acyl carrier protein [Anabaena sp. CCAP 1446/1C]MBY5308832.1 acyl carrier protein [Anabaena sp. CCAP 1446/1C]MCM2409509.1 acyl carrier protein [Anabaena sp. CCAP 1446/1C]
MTRQEIFTKVQIVVAQELANEQQKITPDANLTQDLGADYLDLLAMFQALEDAFGTKIPDVEAKQLITVQQVVNYIDQKVFI